MENKAQIIGEEFFTIKDMKESWKVDEYVEFCHTGNPLKLVKYTQEIEKYQPFMLSYFFVYKEQFNMAQMAEFLKVMLVMWLYFRKKPNVKKKEITEQQFKVILLANFDFLKPWREEPSQRYLHVYDNRKPFYFSDQKGLSLSVLLTCS